MTVVSYETIAADRATLRTRGRLAVAIRAGEKVFEEAAHE
jgi:hypothetical protein